MHRVFYLSKCTILRCSGFAQSPGNGCIECFTSPNARSIDTLDLHNHQEMGASNIVPVRVFLGLLHFALQRLAPSPESRPLPFPLCRRPHNLCFSQLSSLPLYCHLLPPAQDPPSVINSCQKTTLALEMGSASEHAFKFVPITCQSSPCISLCDRPLPPTHCGFNVPPTSLPHHFELLRSPLQQGPRFLVFGVWGLGFRG